MRVKGGLACRCGAVTPDNTSLPAPQGRPLSSLHLPLPFSMEAACALVVVADVVAVAVAVVAMH
jgi:hypothetical protein